MRTLRECITDAEANKKAVGHFNISTVDALWAIFEAARELKVPVIIGVSEGERKFLGVRQVVALVRSIRDEFSYPLFLNADHTYTFEGVKEAVDAGFDSVIFDGAALPFEENVRMAKQCVEYARSVNPEIIVEGELGYIGKSSALLDKIPEGVGPEQYTKPEQAEQFVRETGVDMLAPAVGNIHGMLKAGPNPKHLDIPRIEAVRKSAGVPLVLHGGSGTGDDDFTHGIKAGISIVHINTEIRKAWRDGVREALTKNPDEVAPYKILKTAQEAVHAVVLNRLKLFNS